MTSEQQASRERAKARRIAAAKEVPGGVVIERLGPRTYTTVEGAVYEGFEAYCYDEHGREWYCHSKTEKELDVDIQESIAARWGWA